VSNLLSNALKFTPRAGRVEVRLERHADQAQITVADTGEGISAELLPHIFDRFRQADSSSRRTHGGLGLGLTIVRHLVELHGGTVRAESSGERLGTTMTVTLPVLRAEEVASKGDEVPHGETAGARSLAGLRVLVIDDDRDTCELLELSLHASGADVRSAASAREGMVMLSAFHPSVLVSDIAMPDEDGYVLIRRVRALEGDSGSHTPAIALTAYASHVDREAAISAGYDAHLAKPVSPLHLTKAVARLAGRS
jgi:CheY-like chemotaxis protein/anti-sigma regulatory factor (Ser/Thr protein kinase)